ncbi:hypothetical protein [Pseudomonas sp. NCCP-436]|nr:hypothetical protein [Pseudomonas sp. NCCP-436]
MHIVKALLLPALLIISLLGIDHLHGAGEGQTFRFSESHWEN